jgi:hypothetical protein
MADTLQDMIASRIRGVTRERMMKYYIDQGYGPAEAAALATAEMARRQPPAREVGFEGTGSDELSQMNRDYYRQNPSALSAERANEATLPGYDPSRSDVAPRTTYDPVMNRIEGGGGTIQFSSPMTQEDINVARQTQPIPRGSAEDYGSSRAPMYDESGRPAQTYAEPQSLVERAIRTIGGNQRPQGARAAPAAGERPMFNIPADYVGDAGFTVPEERRNPWDETAIGAPRFQRASAPAARPAPAFDPVKQAPERPAGRTGPNAEGAQSSGFFSNLFKDPYAGKSAQELYGMAQDMQRTGDEYGSNLLTQRAMSMGNPEERARGGATGGGHGKDATIMKALEIIHHMIRGR